MLFSGIGNPTAAAFPEEERATAGEPRREKTEKLIAKATAETSKTAVSTYLGQRGVMTGRMLTPDVCFHLLPRLSLSGRCGLPRLSLYKLTRFSLTPCFTSHSPSSCKYGCQCRYWVKSSA